MQESANAASARMQARRAEAQRRRRRNKKIWRNCVSVMACVVVFCVTYALILPAITMEKDTFCGVEAHVHEAQCYAGNAIVCDPAGDSELPILHTHDELCYDGKTLICTLPELAGHVHTDSCYKTVTTEAHTHDETCNSLTRGELLCTAAEEAGHKHEAACYVPGETLICTEAVREGHTHTDGCYTVESVLTCEAAEGEEHTHTDSCYNETKTLTCATAEDPGHAHEASCYEQVLGCGQEEKEGHTHTDSCYEMVSTLTCGKAESAETVTVRNLVCTQPQIAPHTHDGSCSDESGNLICTIQDAIVHQHTEECVQPAQSEENLICDKQVHEHTLICYSDPTADLETAEDWEKTFADLELTGDWRQDVVAIAKTQLGYEESTKNYIVEGEDAKGYTRYGDWYGVPYGDWCAMFASFCLDYAGVEGMPLDCNCPNWIDTLNNKNLYQVSGGYAPQSGDLIFFDWNANGSSDHVGIVVEFTPAEGDTAATVRTIEGNAGDCVKYNSYNMDDATIMGYGTLPAQLTAEEQAQVDYVISLIDAMPSADEIDAKIEEFEEAEDYEGEEAWLEETYQQVAKAYYYYDQLGETLQPYVTSADKLLELEYIWSVTPYIVVSGINSATPTTVDYATTNQFVELNLYDYNYYINSWWEDNNKYPGFQWNGGAYSKSSYRYSDSTADLGVPNYTTDRNMVDSIDFGNSIITNFEYGNTSDYAKSVNAANVVNQGGTINQGVGSTNVPIGMSQDKQALSNLLINGYPALSDTTSLSFLFGDESADTYNAVTKMNTKTVDGTTSIDGLFQQNSTSGAYFFNSRENHAQFNADTNKFTLYNEIITPNFILYPFGNFLPFNTITDKTQATQVSAFNKSGGMKLYVDGITSDLEAALKDSDTYADTSRSQLLAMLEEYQENWTKYPRSINGTTNKWDNLSAANAIRDFFWKDDNNSGHGPTDNTDFITEDHLAKLYNIDWDVATNFFFGMEMKMNIMMPKDGLTGHDNGNNAAQSWATKSDGTLYLTGEPDGIPDYPMVFNFTGDDDVWVYVDDVLFLDLTGIHRHVGGRIDFQSGKVYYFELSEETGDVSTDPADAYKIYTFAELLEAAGKSSTDVLNENGTFKDYTTHTFNFYYMERGSGSSVCRLNFNFPLLKKNSISVTKQNIADKEDVELTGNPDYYFNIVTPNNELFVGPQSVTGIYQYKIMDSAGNVLKDANGNDLVYETDEYGIFTLKSGQTAVFEGIEENEGEFFVQELIKAEDNDQYGTVYVNDTQARYGKLIDWSYRTYFSDSDSVNTTGPYGYKWYGYSGQDTDSSSNSSFYFEQKNTVATSKLANLEITKVLDGEDTDTTFNIQVTLDGVKLPVGTKYGANKTVETAGIIPLQPGQTATISNILSGTEFTVTELNGENYTVSYAAKNADEVISDGTSIGGVVRAGTTVEVTVTNAEKGTAVEIPVNKTFTNGVEELSHDYDFVLTQVTDITGKERVENGTTQTLDANFTGNTYSGKFSLTYLKSKLTSLPATFWYRIEEDGEETDSLTNTQSFVAEVKVEDGNAGGIEATLVAVHGSDGMSADFVNTIVGDLKLEKIVDGGTEAQTNGSFSFTITLDPDDSGVALASSYPATINGAAEPVNIRVDNGVITVNDVHHGESVVIHDLPIGTKWTITEEMPTGYTVKTAVTVNGTTVNGTEVKTEGTIVAGDTSVVYTNVQLYALPETGGTGTQMYTMAGLMLLLMGTAFLLYRCRKRGREVS